MENKEEKLKLRLVTRGDIPFWMVIFSKYYGIKIITVDYNSHFPSEFNEIKEEGAIYVLIPNSSPFIYPANLVVNKLPSKPLSFHDGSLIIREGQKMDDVCHCTLFSPFDYLSIGSFSGLSCKSLYDAKREILWEEIKKPWVNFCYRELLSLDINKSLIYSKRNTHRDRDTNTDREKEKKDTETMEIETEEGDMEENVGDRGESKVGNMGEKGEKGDMGEKGYIGERKEKDMRCEEETIFPIEALHKKIKVVLPHAYVINLESRKDRRENIEKRLQNIGFTYTIINAVTRDDPIIKERSKGTEHLNNRSEYDKGAVYGCLLSHIKASKELLKSDMEDVLVIEDDVVFHKDFKKMFLMIMTKLDPTYGLLTLMAFNKDYYKGLNSSFRESIFPAPINYDCWTTFGYLINRKCAQWVVDTFDKDFRLVPSIPRFPHLLTSESIIMRSGGFSTSIPLLLDELSESDIGKGNVYHHKEEFKHFGYENYDS